MNTETNRKLLPCRKNIFSGGRDLIYQNKYEYTILPLEIKI